VPTVLVTGGTGTLGQQLRPRLQDAGFAVRIMSRRPRPEPLHPSIQWAQANLASGSGLAEAVAGVDVIVHAASSPRRDPLAVDVRGTARLLEEARKAGVGHLVYVSIVGIDRIPLSYYRYKLEAERLVAEGPVPWSVLRITQFHTFIERVLRRFLRFPVSLLPVDFVYQPIDPGEAADRLVEIVQEGPGGRQPDIGGPEVLPLGHMARLWLQAQGRRMRIVNLPLPGRTARAFRQGFNTAPDGRYGRTTWEEWLALRYP